MKRKQDIESRISVFNLVGLAILAFCYIGALYNVYKIKSSGIVGGKKTVRLAHWQLELGIRDAISELARDFEAQNPGVEVVQIPITERAYAQWVTTQLIGRTAPDLIELGMFNTVDYCGRYFMPLGEILRKPNPYNADNPELKNVPWMDTFSDGLSGTYITELLDYYGVGFSRFTIRVFYNKDLVAKAAGSDRPPRTLDELFAVCQKVREYSDARNAEIVKFNEEQAGEDGAMSEYLPFLRSPRKSPFVLDPIASSRYQVNLFRPRYSSMLTAGRVLELDRNFDGITGFDELVLALLEGDVKYQDEHNVASLDLMKELSKYFNPGFMSIDRMDAGFAFVQGKAAMITSGSWDASSFIKKINDQPAGDAVLEVDGAAASTSKGVAEAFAKAAADGRKVELLIERDGARRRVKVSPRKAATLWESAGIELADISDGGGAARPVVLDVDELSPAHAAGIRKRMRFDVGIFDFPLPKGHLVFGKYFVGNVKEMSGTGFNFGVVKFSDNPGLALKFLQFATTVRNNERLNERAQWIPSVKGAKPIKMLEPFEPNEEGYWGWLSFVQSGGRTAMVEGQLYWPFISGETSTGEYLRKLDEQLPEATATDYDNYVTNYIEKTPDKNYLRSIWLAKFAFARDDAARREASLKLPAAWENYLLFKNAYPKHLVNIGPLTEARPDTPFSRDFFKTYDAFATKRKE